MDVSKLRRRQAKVAHGRMKNPMSSGTGVGRLSHAWRESVHGATVVGMDVLSPTHHVFNINNSLSRQ